MITYILYKEIKLQCNLTNKPFNTLLTTNLKLYWFYTAEDLACKKTQKEHTTENSGKKFHIQKNPVLTKLLLIDDDTIRTSEWKNGVEKNSSRRCYHLAK